MKVLVTGAFGNLGTQTLELLLRRGEHEICCTDLDTPKNRRKQRKLAKLGAFETRWTDVADAAAVEDAVAGQECVLHFAGVIPPLSEEQPELAERVNVTGTRSSAVPGTRKIRSGAAASSSDRANSTATGGEETEDNVLFGDSIAAGELGPGADSPCGSDGASSGNCNT